MTRRILFVNRYFHPDQSATSQLLTDLTAALVRLGYDIHVICSRQRYDDPRVRLATYERVDGVAVHRVWTTRFGRARLLGRALDYATFYMSSAYRMLILVRRGDTLVAETDPPLISIVAMLAATLKRAHLVNWLQDVFPEVASLLGANPLPAFLDAALRAVRDRSLRAARLNVVLGRRMGERLLALGVADSRIQVIENWADVDPQPPKTAEESALRRALGLTDEFVVGYSGNLGRAHEHQTLLGAAERLRADPRVMFLMIGGGAGMLQLKREVVERGLTAFRFLDYQPRQAVADCLAAADVHWVSLRPALEGYIVPSKYYGILAAARPVIFIGDADGELARDIRAAACGAVVLDGDSAALADLLRNWQADAPARERMGQAGYRRYCERYRAHRAFQAWTTALGPPPAPRDAGQRNKSYAGL